MATLNAELKAHFNKFQTALEKDNATVRSEISIHSDVFFSSYKQICAFRGWHEIAMGGLPEDVVGFFIEGHNDLLTSHVHAVNGMWRSANIALRTFMESYLAFIFFKDHMVELVQWKAGDFRIEPKALRQYCVTHPEIGIYPVVRAAASRLDSQYSKLSWSVHGSKIDFRMTSTSAYPAIATADLARLGHWRKMQADVVRVACLIFLGINIKRMTGAAHPLFRKLLAETFTLTCRQAVKAQTGINL